MIVLRALAATVAVIGLLGLVAEPCAAAEAGWDPRFGTMGMDGDVDPVVVYQGRVIVGGYFDRAGFELVNCITAFDGTSWVPMANGFDQPPVHALAVDGDFLYAGGMICYADDVVTDSIAMWDGTGWIGLGNGLNDPVRAMAVAPNHDLYVTGEFTRAGDVTAVGIARWDGREWHPVGDSLNEKVGAVVIGGGKIFTSGGFPEIRGIVFNNLAQMDLEGRRWQPIAGGATWQGSGITVVPALYYDEDTGDLYAGGHFDRIGDVAANGIARWDGESWHPLGSGLSGGSFLNVRIILKRADDFFVAGDFQTAGGKIVNNVARWDGQEWHPLGGGVNHLVKGMAFQGQDIWLGGNFTEAGGIPSMHVARYTDPDLVAASFESVVATPSVEGIDVRWTLESWSIPTGFRVIRSIDGRRETVAGAGEPLDPTVTRFVDPRVDTGREYTYRVIAVTADGDEIRSNAATSRAPTQKLRLLGNVPNPFNPETRIRFTLPRTGEVELVVFDARGRRVVTLVDGERSGGLHEETWLGTDDAGRSVGSGSYFYRLRYGDRTLTGRMTLLQ